MSSFQSYDPLGYCSELPPHLCALLALLIMSLFAVLGFMLLQVQVQVQVQVLPDHHAPLPFISLVLTAFHLILPNGSKCATQPSVATGDGP